MDYWVAVPRTERVWTSRFGDLFGIEGIRPTARIEVLPYAAGSSIINGNRDLRNPFDDGKNLSGQTGADFKMGIGPNLTLEGTVNPDFGQIEADPAEVNLTGFETFFEEKRPFFIEGSRALNMSVANNFFYSRRIGAPPTVSASGDFVDYPRTTTILGAAKLTGRLSSGTTLGFLGALTDEEFAQTSNQGAIQSLRVAPRTSYGLARVQQEFGPSASTVGFMTTVAHREMEEDDPLAALLSRNAVYVAGDSTLRFLDGQYELNSYAGWSFVDGDATAIARMQRSNVMYLQRPDRREQIYDPTRTMISGYKWGTALERTAGRHWLWQVQVAQESPAFQTNDIGRLSFADGINVNTDIDYRETVPGAIFRNYSFGVRQQNEWNNDGNRMGGSIQGRIRLTFLNFWTLNLNSGPNFRTLDGRLTRGGPLMGGPSGWSSNVELGNRVSARSRWTGRIEYNADENGGKTVDLRTEMSFRPGARWQFSLRPNYIRQTESQQYVATLAGGRAETYGQRYIFSYIDRSTWSTQFRLGYTIRPDMNVDLYTEPFAASGRYYDYGELPAPRARDRRLYGTDGTAMTLQPDGSRLITDGASTFTLRNDDFNVRSFRSNIVLRWEWRPGSTLYLVWQQDRRISESLSERIGVGDMFRSLTAPGANVFAVKMSFWMPVR
jgi:hypothetical protein